INKDPRDVALESLPFTNSAYLRYNNELWYVRKHLNWFQKQLEKIGLLKQRRLLKKVQGRALERFDQGMELYSKPYQHLSDRKIELAGLLTGHTHRTAWQQFLHYFANFCVGFMAIGCGISTAATFISLNLMTGGAATAIAAIFFLTGAAVNWWIFKRYVSPVLINLFGREKFFVNEKGETLSLTKKAAMIIALIFSLSVGITYAGLTYVSTIALPATFSFLGAISIALPPVAGLLAAVAFFCMTALMLKDIADLIKKVDVWGEIVKFCKNMVDTDPNLDQNKVNGEPKSRPRIIAERFLTTFFTAVFIPVACLGLYMTMNACVPGVKAILLNVIPSAAEMTASIVSLGFAFIGQIPFGIATAIETICKCVPGFFQNVSDFYHYAADKIHGKKREPKKIDPATVIQKGETAPKPDSLLVAEIKEGCVVGNASGNGVISLAGATSTNSTFWVIIAFISGFFNSFSAGKPAVSNRPKVPSVLPDSGVMKALGGSPDISDAKDVVPKTVSRDNEMFIKGQQSAAAIQGRMLPIPLQLQKEIRSNTYDSKASYRNMKENLQPPSESPMAEDKSTEDNAEAKSTKDKLVFRSQPIALGARALLNAPFESPTSTLESSSALFSKLNAHAVELKKKRIKKTCDDMAMDYNKDFSKQRIIAGAA
ncbi:MAG TPA: hypothetical protein VLH77_00370, partial [Gammaproteobacteria bacterium]|nr:hypothetical protein [Gammaproteobacteria bacterium]